MSVHAGPCAAWPVWRNTMHDWRHAKASSDEKPCANVRWCCVGRSGKKRDRSLTLRGPSVPAGCSWLNATYHRVGSEAAHPTS